MRAYALIFLAFWFSSLFAPTQSKCESIRVVNQPVVEVVPSTNEKDNISDSLDLKTIKYFKMCSTFSNKEDRRKIRSIAKDLGIKTSYLYKIFYIECRGNIYATNPYSGATGLIGFLPVTARKLGTNTDELRTMTVNQQLDYVEKYFKVVLKGKKVQRAADVYLAIFSPCDLHKSDSTIIGNISRSKKIYHQNRILDTDKDSVITVKDINKFISNL